MIEALSAFWYWGGGAVPALLAAVAIWAGVYLGAVLLCRKIGPAAIRRLGEEKHPLPRYFLLGFNRPVFYFLQFLGLCLALLFLAHAIQSSVFPKSLLGFMAALPPVLHKAIRIAAIVAVAFGLVLSSDVTMLTLHHVRHKLDIHMGKSVSRFLAAVFNVVVVAIAVVLVLSELNYNINGLIAGLGLGGLTIALAAKDSFENFFGGLVLIMEKPFEIGDWIACDGVEGTVEDITLRSTKIRTSAGSLTVVPNAKLAGSAITNWSGTMEKRRADFTLNLEYATAKKQIKNFAAAIQTMLETDPEVLPGSITVRFFGFGASSLDLRVIFYTALPGFADFVRIQERINFAVMDLAAKLGIQFAYPSQSVYLMAENGRGPKSGEKASEIKTANLQTPNPPDSAPDGAPQ